MLIIGGFVLSPNGRKKGLKLGLQVCQRYNAVALSENYDIVVSRSKPKLVPAEILSTQALESISIVGFSNFPRCGNAHARSFFCPWPVSVYNKDNSLCLVVLTKPTDCQKIPPLENPVSFC